MRDKRIIDTFEIGTFKDLCQIHHYIFQDVFEFNGKKRTVNIYKNNFMFALYLFLDNNLSQIDKIPENTFDEIIDKYAQMNIYILWIWGLQNKNLIKLLDI
ncbi:cell division protein [Mycoplasmopsis agalactiae]|nr:cell division protein [Mycoplasmopsis agalactiae]